MWLDVNITAWFSLPLPLPLLSLSLSPPTQCVCFDVAEIAECYLEEHESPSHLPSLLSALPRVADLVVRLKPKLISDPLLSPTSGQPYSYMHICK